MSLTFMRADELMKIRQNVMRLTTGSKAIDEVLAGGLETQTITEFYGEYGSGKSQLCHQMCVNVQLPTERGGLNGAALYIDTENTFRTERIIQMAQHMGLNPEDESKNHLRRSIHLRPPNVPPRKRRQNHQRKQRSSYSH
jgi:DNA repair protein RadA